MTTNPVESSLIARVGFDVIAGRLLIVFRDGATVEYEAGADLFCHFMAAPSKGKFWRALIKSKPVLSTSRKPETSQLKEPEPIPSPVLQTYEPDDCCATPLHRELRTGKLDTATEWHCPKCGHRWSPVATGVMRHWQPACDVEVFR